jgi:hypothetical protein
MGSTDKEPMTARLSASLESNPRVVQIKTVCAWCPKKNQEACHDLFREQVSHGICPQCLREKFQWAKEGE